MSKPPKLYIHRKTLKNPLKIHYVTWTLTLWTNKPFSVWTPNQPNEPNRPWCRRPCQSLFLITSEKIINVVVESNVNPKEGGGTSRCEDEMNPTYENQNVWELSNLEKVLTQGVHDDGKPTSKILSDINSNNLIQPHFLSPRSLSNRNLIDSVCPPK